MRIGAHRLRDRRAFSVMQELDMLGVLARIGHPAATLLDPVLVWLRLDRREADVIEHEHSILPKSLTFAMGRAADSAARFRRLQSRLDRLDVDALIVRREGEAISVRLDLGLVEGVGLVDEVVFAN